MPSRLPPLPLWAGSIPVLLHHLPGSEQLLDLVCHLLVPSQHHDACGLLVEPVAQVQGLCLVAMKHLCQDREDITDAELDPRATYDGKGQRFRWPGKAPPKKSAWERKPSLD